MECLICCHTYDESTKAPKILPCGHTYCVECLGQLLNTTYYRITCPKDRKTFPLPTGRVNTLPLNYAILEVLSDMCQQCRVKPHDGCCIPEHCSKHLCNTCKKSHIQLLHAELTTSLSEMRQHIVKLQSVCEGQNDDLSNTVDMSELAIAQVSKVFDEERDRLVESLRLPEVDSEDYTQWKDDLSMRVSQSMTFIDESMGRLQQAGAYDGSTLAELKREFLVERDKNSQAEITKNPLVQLNLRAFQEMFHSMMPNLKQCLLYQEPAVEVSAPLTPEPVTQSTNNASPDYKSASFKSSFTQRKQKHGLDFLPWGASTSPVTGNIAVSDSQNHKILILTPDLQLVLEFGTKGANENCLNNPAGLAFTSHGNLFIADCDNHRIRQVTEQGKLVSIFGRKGSGPSEFIHPRGIAWHDHLLYIADSENYRIQIIRDDGWPMKMIGSRGSGIGQFDRRPWHVAVSPQFNKLVVSGCSGDLYFFQVDGQYGNAIKAGKPPHQINPSGLCPDELGNLIVSDWQNGSLTVLGVKEEVVALISSPKMYYPQALTITSSGDIMVCDRKHHRLILYDVPKV